VHGDLTAGHPVGLQRLVPSSTSKYKRQSPQTGAASYLTMHLLPSDPSIHGAKSSLPAVRNVAHPHGACVLPGDDGFPRPGHRRRRIYEFYGDMNYVNGRVMPFFEVEPRRYPLRCPQRRQLSLLSGDTSRNGNLCTLRRTETVSGYSEGSEPTFSHPFI
jgi:hypothetical protein